MIKSILVVAEDSPPRGALIARLEAEGYLVVPAGGRAEAQEILEGLVPGAVLVDLTLPGRQGRLLTGELEAHPRLRMVPRLLLLGAWRRNSRPTGGAAVFVKPLELDHLARTLRVVYPPPLRSIGPAPVRSTRPAPDDAIWTALAS
jgi:two-component system response regulator (stage 0 sporulation protein F)